MIEVNGKIIKPEIEKLNAEEIIRDYRLAVRSREASILGRREVMAGKAKFGIFGDGKEVAQLALAKAFHKGDFRSGYYRDQTLMFALGEHTIEEFFAQLYAHTDVQAEPATAGRAMNCHFATRSLHENGTWKNLSGMYNSSADVSPTGSQMPRLVGLAYASRLYRELKTLRDLRQFSNRGNEVAFGTIGNASCAEGMFWEAVNAIGVLQAPVVLSVWDDDYGISVSNEQQIIKRDISRALRGFQRKRGAKDGYDIYTVKGWDYPSLVATYSKAAAVARRQHVPQFIHVKELTQPLGHSTSGSHERYKSGARLEWERDFDCIKKMREWIIAEEIASAAELDRFEAEDRREVLRLRDKAWDAYFGPIRAEVQTCCEMIDALAAASPQGAELARICSDLRRNQAPFRRDLMAAVERVLIKTRRESHPAIQRLREWKNRQNAEAEVHYSTHVHSESVESALNVPEIKPVYAAQPPRKTGFEILNACFDAALKRDPRIIAFGEDVGKLGDVNQGFRGLQEKYGELRVADTGIRESTIIGQAIGMAMRGLRPIAEIQYLDYMLYALQIISDDLATLHWRTKGGQKAPVIIRTRGHRLEGIWHSGSLMAGLLHLVRGVYVLVPRNMVQAAGFYNTLLQSDDAAILVEVLNGYRLREPMPENIGDFTVPLGVPEVLRPGRDVTIVTYGACCRVVQEAASLLQEVGIDSEIIDVQTLLPFDMPGVIAESLKKTNRIVFVDEDVPGGTTAYMLQEVLEKQKGYYWLDAEPRTVSGKPHRPAYGSDGDYWSKPNPETVFEAVYELMSEADPARFPIFYK